MNPQVEKDLNAFGKEFINELIKQLVKANKVASGDLINHLSYRIVEEHGEIHIQISDKSKNKHLKYVDEGRRKGKKLPPHNLID